MLPVEIIYLPGCPYCRKAKLAAEELKNENENYGRVPVHWIDESEEPDTITDYNYYYVPSVFYGKRKYFEAHPGDSYEKIRDGIRDAFDMAVYDGPGSEHTAPQQNNSL